MRINLDSFTSKDPQDIKVGDPCTICFVTDSRPATLVKIVNPKEIKVQIDDYKCIKGDVFNNPEYEYTRNPNNPVYTFTLRKNGYWILKGSNMKDGTCCSIGFKRYYYDVNF